MSQKTLTISDEQGDEVITLKINDVFDLVLKSPMVTQVFARAVTVLVMKAAGGVVQEIIVNIGETRDKIDLELHRSRVSLNAAKLKATTDIIAEKYNEADRNPDYPLPMKEELKNSLYNLFYVEMEKITPRRVE